MTTSKAEIIARLQKEILPLQGYKPVGPGSAVEVGLGPIRSAFPGGQFPLGAIHEFTCSGAETVSATGGFISLILRSLMQTGGITIWITASRTVFPPALKSFHMQPDKIIFIEVQKLGDMQWVMEEALKCDGLAAVVAEMQELDFTASRRLQLAVEQSRVTGFVIRNNPRMLKPTACISRWRISPISSLQEADMPGLGFPRWKIELLKIRNGKPGTWEVESVGGRFRHPIKLVPVSIPRKQQIG